MKKTISLVLALALAFAGNMNVYAEEKPEKIVTAMDSYSGEIIENNVPLNISEDKISFVYQGQPYVFPIEEININTNDGRNIEGANFYSGNNGDLICNVVEYNGKYCVQVVNTSQSIAARKNNEKDNFTMICGDASEKTTKAVSNTLKLENKKMNPAGKVSTELDTLAAGSTYNLYVFVSCKSFPFLISGGSAEGSAKSTKSSGSNYKVTGVKYSVTYNWPSDGVSLWYDYQNSKVACESPAWPSAQTTSIPGTWTINGNTGAFQAEATGSFLIKNIPVMNTHYSVCNMDGTSR